MSSLLDLSYYWLRLNIVQDPTDPSSWTLEGSVGGEVLCSMEPRSFMRLHSSWGSHLVRGLVYSGLCLLFLDVSPDVRKGPGRDEGNQREQGAEQVEERSEAK